MPNFSPFASAYSRQSSRTTQPWQTALASLVDAPRSGKNRSGSTPRQLAYICQPSASVTSSAFAMCFLRTVDPAGAPGRLAGPPGAATARALTTL
jgi:hypothetical protein